MFFNLRSFIIVTSLFFLTSVTLAQKSFTPVTGIGIQSGVNLNGVRFVPSVGQKQILGYSGGFYFNYLGEKHAGLQVELNYVQRGWREESDTIPHYKRVMSYIELPFLTHFVFGQKVRVNIHLGPYISYQTAYWEEIDKPGDINGGIYYRSADRKSLYRFRIGEICLLCPGIRTDVHANRHQSGTDPGSLPDW